MVESPFEHCELFVTNEIFIEVGKAPCEVSTLPNAISKVSMKEGKAIPSLGGETVGDRKGL